MYTMETESMTEDWYDATVVSNSILGDAFSVDEKCVFRRLAQEETTKFEVFNLKDTIKLLTGDEAKTQLISVRDTKNNVVRAKDQGYIDWKYSICES